jgi:hypothetical protein
MLREFSRSEKARKEIKRTCLSIMSYPQRNLIHLAKASAERHLSTIISDPVLYLATFRYGMDFVWGEFFALPLYSPSGGLTPQPPNAPFQCFCSSN